MPNSPTNESATPMRPETELLLACARDFDTGNGSERVGRLLDQELDWKFLARNAHAHGMQPILYKTIRDTGLDRVPAAFLSELKLYFDVNDLRMQFMTIQMLRLVELLESHGIAVVPYKGPVLAASVYGDTALRQAGDLDMLVHKPDVLAARDLCVEEIGYRPRTEMTEEEELEFMRDDYEYRLFHEDWGVYLGLHWRITPDRLDFPFDQLDAWNRLQKVPIRNAEVSTFAPEDLLVLLSVHGTKDFWRRIIWICDVATLIRKEQIDWDRVVQRASDLGGYRMLMLGLALAHQLLDTSLPESICRRLEDDRMMPPLLQMAHQNMVAVDAEPEDQRIFLGGYLMARERIQDRVKNYIRLVADYEWLTPSSVEHAFWQFPSWCSPLYPILRPLQYTCKYVVDPVWQVVKRPIYRLRQ